MRARSIPLGFGMLIKRHVKWTLLLRGPPQQNQGARSIRGAAGLHRPRCRVLFEDFPSCRVIIHDADFAIAKFGNWTLARPL